MKRYWYYIRYSCYKSCGVGLSFTGSAEIGVSEEIKSKDVIDEIANTIIQNLIDEGKPINSNPVFIDFYSLLRVEDEASEQE